MQQEPELLTFQAGAESRGNDALICWECLLVPTVIPGPNLPLTLLSSPPPAGSAPLFTSLFSTFFIPFCFGRFTKLNLIKQEGNHSKMLTGDIVQSPDLNPTEALQHDMKTDVLHPTRVSSFSASAGH
ncbi:hypothetical protein XENOCAPTIV_025815 [Xenoophorus captivus]|uniref:Uncharacterized protein n=1 Tax=Xenoophorus captivus TaxID=1517983 RepID=A0ABV0RS54_9TELE